MVHNGIVKIQTWRTDFYYWKSYGHIMYGLLDTPFSNADICHPRGVSWMVIQLWVLRLTLFKNKSGDIEQSCLISMLYLVVIVVIYLSNLFQHMF